MQASRRQRGERSPRRPQQRVFSCIKTRLALFGSSFFAFIALGQHICSLFNHQDFNIEKHGRTGGRTQRVRHRTHTNQPPPTNKNRRKVRARAIYTPTGEILNIIYRSDNYTPGLSQPLSPLSYPSLATGSSVPTAQKRRGKRRRLAAIRIVVFVLQSAPFHLPLDSMCLSLGRRSELNVNNTTASKRSCQDR